MATLGGGPGLAQGWVPAQNQLLVQDWALRCALLGEAEVAPSHFLVEVDLCLAHFVFGLLIPLLLYCLFLAQVEDELLLLVLFCLVKVCFVQLDVGSSADIIRG